MELSRTTATHCPYCALQCGMTLSPGGGGDLEISARDFPSNRGAMCRKGWTSADLLRAPDRLTTPLLRADKGGPLLPVSWPEAVDHIASSVQRIQADHGRDAVGVFGGGGLTNETAYTLGKFARVVLQTRSIDYNGRFCMASAAAACNKAFGIDRGLPFPVSDLAHPHVILLVGANPAETMPPLMQYFDEQQARGGKLIVVDPRRTVTAARADTHLQITPGTDGALASALLKVVIRDGFLDHRFIERRTSGFEAVRHKVATCWPDRMERITGVPAAQIVETAHLLGKAPSLMVLTGRGSEQQSQGVDNVLAYINLTLALGQMGRTFCGFGSLTGQGNGQGGREHGQKSDQLPGYRRLADPAHRQYVAGVWGIPPDDLPGPGPSATELLHSLGEPGGLRALLVMGSNLLVSAPDASALEPRLGKLELLVVADLFLSETARRADVVLPVTQWAEHEGTMTNLEGRLLHRRPARAPPAGVRTDLQILKLLAQALGRGHHVSDQPEVVFEELQRASAGGLADYSGFSYERVRNGEELFWPCPGLDHPGTPRLFLDRFATSDGRARFHPVDHPLSLEQPDEQYPLYLTTGRVLAHYQSGTQTARVPSLLAAEPEAFVEIHPHLAASFGIAEGDLVALRTRRGRAHFRARFVSSMRLDTLFVPFHWGGEGRANTLTSSAVDPTSKIPEFKLSAVAIEPSAATPNPKRRS